MSKPKAKAAKKKRTRKAKPPTDGQLLLDGPPPPAADAPKAQRRVFDEIYLEDMCAHIGMGFSLRSWAAMTGHDPAAVVRWIQADPDRNKAYREARKMQADAHIDGLIEIADEVLPLNTFGSVDSGAVNDKRLRIDTRKWIAAKFHPQLYGDKVAIDGTFDVTTKKPDEIMGLIVGLLATHGLRITPAEDGDPDGPRETG